MSIIVEAGSATMGSFGAQGAVISMNATPQMLAVLQEIAQESGQPLDAVFTQAIALYRAALRVTAEGKHLGYAASASALEAEFTDLIAPQGSLA